MTCSLFYLIKNSLILYINENLKQHEYCQVITWDIYLNPGIQLFNLTKFTTKLDSKSKISLINTIKNLSTFNSNIMEKLFHNHFGDSMSVYYTCSDVSDLLNPYLLKYTKSICFFTLFFSVLKHYYLFYEFLINNCHWIHIKI